MGYTKYEVMIFLENGNPVAGAQVEAFNRNAVLPSSKNFTGTTGPDGSYAWDTLATGFNNDTYDFHSFKEIESILYEAVWSERVMPNKPYQKDVTLHTQLLKDLKELNIPKSILDKVNSEDSGKYILSAIDELNKCIRYNLSKSAVTLSTSILEGVIKIHLTKKNAWDESFDNVTFGRLISKIKNKNIVAAGLMNKLEALNKLRLPAAHFKGTDTTTDEARIGMSVVKEFLYLAFQD